jgi:hypothetical protein
MPEFRLDVKRFSDCRLSKKVLDMMVEVIVVSPAVRVIVISASADRESIVEGREDAFPAIGVVVASESGDVELCRISSESGVNSLKPGVAGPPNVTTLRLVAVMLG